MLSPFTSPTALTAIAAARAARCGSGASSDHGRAASVGHDPHQTGALGCG
jgi:hypothetical protein